MVRSALLLACAALLLVGCGRSTSDRAMSGAGIGAAAGAATGAATGGSVLGGAVLGGAAGAATGAATDEDDIDLGDPVWNRGEDDDDDDDGDLF
jgi:osmotically inducible lipoprotein OsmB